MDKTSKREQAIGFLNSMRGRYIVAQALSVAIKTLSAVPPPHTEVSNIADMEYIRENIFDFPFEEIHGS
jgi:hypothetical protein